MKKRVSNPNIGTSVAIGAGIGSALYEAFDEVFWTGVGVALGAAIESSKIAIDKEDWV